MENAPDPIRRSPRRARGCVLAQPPQLEGGLRGRSLSGSEGAGRESSPSGLGVLLTGGKATDPGA